MTIYHIYSHVIMCTTIRVIVWKVLSQFSHKKEEIYSLIVENLFIMFIWVSSWKNAYKLSRRLM